MMTCWAYLQKVLYKTHNDWSLGMVELISSIVGLLIFYIVKCDRSVVTK